MSEWQKWVVWAIESTDRPQSWILTQIKTRFGIAKTQTQDFIRTHFAPEFLTARAKKLAKKHMPDEVKSVIRQTALKRQKIISVVRQSENHFNGI